MLSASRTKPGDGQKKSTQYRRQLWEEPVKAEEPINKELPKSVKAEPSKDENNEEPLVEEWKEILKVLKTSCPLIAGVLDGSRAFVSGQYLLIDAPNPQFRDLINNKNSIYKDSVRKAAAQVLGKTYKLGPYHKPQVSAEEDPLKALAEKLKQMQV